MKKLTALLALATFLSFTNGPASFSARSVEKSFEKIKDHIYINKYEVSNADYRAFVAAAEADPAVFKTALPDTAVWPNPGHSPGPMTAFYFRHPSYDNYPVVGVSYENALACCKWLTDAYKKDGKRKFSKVIFRLPAKEEWILAANGGNEKKQYPWGSGFISNSRHMSLCNYNEIIEPANADRQTYLKLTSPVKSFYPSSYGLYNMSGNVAEMISEKGIAKGGSYSDPAGMVTIASEKKYTGPTADIGFRVLMEVLEN